MQQIEMTRGVFILTVVGTHPKSGLPLAAEFRIFWLSGKPISSHRYWGDLTTFDGAPLPWAELTPIAERIPSRFFTMELHSFLRVAGPSWSSATVKLRGYPRQI